MNGNVLMSEIFLVFICADSATLAKQGAHYVTLTRATCLAAADEGWRSLYCI